MKLKKIERKKNNYFPPKGGGVKGRWKIPPKFFFLPLPLEVTNKLPGQKTRSCIDIIKASGEIPPWCEDDLSYCRGFV